NAPRSPYLWLVQLRAYCLAHIAMLRRTIPVGCNRLHHLPSLLLYAVARHRHGRSTAPDLLDCDPAVSPSRAKGSHRSCRRHRATVVSGFLPAPKLLVAVDPVLDPNLGTGTIELEAVRSSRLRVRRAISLLRDGREPRRRRPGIGEPVHILG